MEAAEEGAKSFGLPMKVAPIYKDGNLLWGFTVGIVRDGVTVTSLSVKFDDETVVKRAWVGRGPDGFPAMEGSSQEIAGKNFEIRKTDDNPVDEQLRSVIRTFCQSLVSAINKYYAFGSAFSDDST
ncbi:hypothetical protein WJX72_011615 [[Myrmecia] bisecta]|uniref:Uncharacterized protein n=1 Tax=[Myrmecia] bisecta TaxID=41462 RepID=A0AAW1QGL0_9CHLO